MIKRRWLGTAVCSALFALAGCQGRPVVGPAGPAGGQGPAGAQGAPGPAGPPGIVTYPDGGSLCVPGQPFCDGNTLWNCTHNGLDGTRPADCTRRSSATNPWICATTQCEGAPACCRASAPLCTWTISSPDAGSGTDFSGNLCAGPNPSPCAPEAPFTLFWGSTTSNSCAVPSVLLFLSITRPFTVGSPINVGDPRLNFNEEVTNASGTVGCPASSGTVTVLSDVPAWSVSVDVTLTSTCATTFPNQQVLAAFSGNL